MPDLGGQTNKGNKRSVSLRCQQTSIFGPQIGANMNDMFPKDCGKFFFS